LLVETLRDPAGPGGRAKEERMTWRLRSAAWSAGVAVMIALGAGCGDNNGNGGGGGGGGGGVGLGDNAAVQTRPDALKVDIQGVEVPEGGGAPTITFTVTDGTTAVTTLVQEIKNGVAQPPTFPWTSVPRVVLSKLDATSGDFTSYYTTSQTGRQWQRPGETAVNDPVQASATQATFDQAPTDATLDQRLTHQGGGVYRYTLAAIPADAQVDRAATHTAGIWLTRHTAAGEAATSSSTDTVNFVPAGGTAARNEVVSLTACNQCHAPAVAAHDERLGATLCQTCHSPQSTDPDTGNTVNFKVMVHKIHRGGDLPSAQGATGTPYTIVGFRPPGNTDPAGGVHVYDQGFINDVRNCTLCHQGKDADRWKNNANLAACTSCHDNVRFDGSAPTPCALDDALVLTGNCNHQTVGQTACNTCHSATAASIGVETVHVPGSEQAKAFRYDIMDVTVGADRVPVVTFAVRKTDNSAYDLATDPAYTTQGTSLTAKFGWPTTDYTNEGSGATFGQPLSVTIVGGTPPALNAAAVTPVTGQPGVYQLRATAPVPPGVTSASVHLEGHPILGGEEMPVENAIRNFGVGGGAAADRRQVVDVQKCDACHGQLSAHGSNRNNVIQVCTVCHNPRATDAGRRGAGSPGEGQPAQSIDFKVMIHEIHAAGIRNDEITIFGFGNTPHTFPGDIPSTTPNCAICHVAGTWNLPLNAAVAGTTLVGADTQVPATIAVCTSCHDQTRFEGSGLPSCSGLAEPNSEPCLHTGGPATTDATCAACHGAGAQFDVSSVHPIQ
jgi:OmcA/MtrC family decaheme c-type cytochrome